MSENQEFVDFEIDVEGGLEDVNAWGGEFRLVPPGEWTLDITHIEQTNSKEKKTPMIKVTFEVADEGEYNGAKLFGNYALTDKAMGRIKQLMVACGARLDKIRASELINQRIRAEVVHTESEGPPDADGNPGKTRTFANVQNEMPLDGEVETQPEPEPAPPPKAAAKPAAKPAAAPPPVSRATQQPARNGARRA